MKPTYTVRLTGDLGPDERERIAARVAGVTDIEADKIERLLERGAGRDLIKPSSASVANRLASVLAEAGAPVQLTPVTEPEPTPPEAVEPERVAPSATDEDVLRPRQSAPSREAPAEPPAEPEAEPQAEAPAEPTVEPTAEPRAERAAEPPVAPAADAEDEPAEEARAAGPGRLTPAEPAETAPPPAPGAAAALPESGAAAEPESERPPEPEATVTPPTDPGVRARPADQEREPPPPPRTVEPPTRPARANGGTALLGSIGAAVLGIGAVFAMDLLVNPIAIGVLVLAVLALVLSLLGQRRATWLPGLGALALVVWALANAPDGAMATLAANWQWYAMLAGCLLVIVAGFQEAQRGRGR